MNILHTSDWHLGHGLHNTPREYEHQCFLDWLAETLAKTDADALIVAGDIYDSSNPPSSAQRALYDFLARIQRERPRHFKTIIVGGNHDSAIRLDAPSPLLDSLNIHVVGGVPKKGGERDLDRLTVPLKDKAGNITAWVAAMPFIRVPDLPPCSPEQGRDSMVEGVRRLYAELFAHVETKREPHQALLATGHCYMHAAQLSEFSERKILGGNQHALPADIFPPEVTYAALGHIHKAQQVEGLAHIRYSGSPLPLSFAEKDYTHQVNLIKLDGPRLAGVTELAVPRTVAMLSLKDVDADNLEDALADLPEMPELIAEEQRPYLEVGVALNKPEAGLRHRIELALEGKSPRLLKLTLARKQKGGALADTVTESLQEMKAEEVFSRRYRQVHHEDPPGDLLAMFHELVELVAREDT